MNIILTSVYLVSALFALVCGWVYPAAKPWSYFAAGACAIHLVFGLVVANASLMDAARIAALSWQGLSSLLIWVLLLPYNSGEGVGWLLAAVALLCFTILVTIVTTLVLKKGGLADSPT